jgi:hypothetical protein
MVVLIVVAAVAVHKYCLHLVYTYILGMHPMYVA